MALAQNTFDYLQPSTLQVDKMNRARLAAKLYADELERLVPDGADKTYLLRKLREVAMWANVAITRETDGNQRVV